MLNPITRAGCPDAYLQALAAGNDFLYKHETHDSATKAGLWRTEKPTKKQRKWLPPEFKKDRKITRGDAGAILTFKIVAAHKIRELAFIANLGVGS